MGYFTRRKALLSAGGAVSAPAGYSFLTETIDGTVYYLTETIGGVVYYWIEAPQ